MQSTGSKLAPTAPRPLSTATTGIDGCVGCYLCLFSEGGSGHFCGFWQKVQAYEAHRVPHHGCLKIFFFCEVFAHVHAFVSKVLESVVYSKGRVGLSGERRFTAVRDDVVLVLLSYGICRRSAV